MADDDPFADLGETLENDDAASEPEPDTTSDDVSPPEEHGTDPMTDSAFSYEDAQQRPFYARANTITKFDAWLKYELERELSERGYRNIVVREMTDALLRTAVDEDIVDEVAERFEQARAEDISESNK